jgi:putative isomerase
MVQATRRSILKAAGSAVAAAATRGVAQSGSLATGRERLLAYFARVAPQLLRPAEGALLYPSIAPTLPGKAYSTELWDWDTYWTALGLFRIARATHNTELHGQICAHAQGSLRNFLHYQSPEGRIPIQINIHHSDFFGSADPSHRVANQAKPVFAQLGLLIANECGNVEWLTPDFDHLLRFYASWVRTNRSAVGLMVWSNDVAIGNDNDPTTFGRPDFSSANLLLNCLFYRDLVAAAELAGRLGRAADQQKLANDARALGGAIQANCWDPRDRFYYTVDVQCVDRRAELIPNVPQGMAMAWHTLPLRIQVFTGFLPLWCGLASRPQAQDLVHLHFANPATFHGAYGVRTLAKNETMYSLVPSSNPSNWLGPVWIISNYLVWRGLVDYGFAHEADELARATVEMLANDLERHGSLNEYYDPDTGLALSHDGFVDWNLLVAEMMESGLAN